MPSIDMLMQDGSSYSTECLNRFGAPRSLESRKVQNLRARVRVHVREHVFVFKHLR